MAESELDRIERQMTELKQKRTAALKRDREKKRREEQRRRQIIGSLVTEYADETLSAMVNKLLVEHASPADYHLWPHLWPDLFPDEVNGDMQDEPTASERGQQLLQELKAVPRQETENSG